MYIAPNTLVRFIQNVPLDNTYTHTLWFHQKQGSDQVMHTAEWWQERYFYLHRKFNILSQSYQDPNKNLMRIEKRYEDVVDCNYLSFQNGSHGGVNAKTYYAFITGIRYVNENVTEVEYQIDVIQTYMFDYDLKECFIDREHSDSDGWFEHTLPENLDLGDEYMCYDHRYVDLGTTVVDDDNVIYAEPASNPVDRVMKVKILLNRKRSGQVSDNSTFTNGVYCSTSTRDYVADDVANIDFYINSINENDIVAMYQYPKILDAIDWNEKKYAYTNISKAGLEFPDKFRELPYMAKNKKMCTYPYTKLVVSNNGGSTQEYKYEHFKYYNSTTSVDAYNEGLYLRFKLWGTSETEPFIVLFPMNYRGVVDDYDNGVAMANFPQCAWSGDTFKTWWAQNKNQFSTGLIADTLSSLINAGNYGGLAMQFADPSASLPMTSLGIEAAMPVTAIHMANRSLQAGVNAAVTVAKSMAKVQDIKNMPSNLHGAAQTNCINAKYSRYRFDIFEMKIKKENAILIDQYFSRYGYACKKIKVPNRYVRQHWTYTKTVGCEITDNVARDIARQICNIYDNGITFWNFDDAEHVGDYSYFSWNNNPLSGL